MNLKGKVTTAVRTDPGRVRTNNEDAVTEDQKIGLLVLADGMGGHNAGEVASSMAIVAVQETVRAGWTWLKHGKTDEKSGFSVEAVLLRGAIEAAHASVKQAAKNQPQLEGMGTTLVTCILNQDRLAVAHVGDSRLYRLRNGILERLTKDHTLREELVSKGFYKPEDAKQQVRRNILTRAVGTGDLISVDLLDEMLMEGDILLLCSDGLTDMVPDKDIGLTLRQFAASLDGAAQKLIELANERGGKDNVSVILARVDRVPDGRGLFEKLAEWF